MAIIEYLQESLLSESGLSRLTQHMDAHDTGTITAFRATKDCTKSSTDDSNIMTYKENRQRQKSLLLKLQRLGYGVTSVKSSYIENYGSDEAIEVGESVFFVVDVKNTGNLKKDLITLGSEFDQDSVLFIPKGGETATLIGTNKCPNNFLSYGQETTFENRAMGKGGEFMTKVHGRPFVFESVIIEHIERSDYSWKLGRKLGAETPWNELSISDEDIF